MNDFPDWNKPRYKLVSASVNGWYYFVNVHTSGLAREGYAIRRSDFWGKKFRGVS